LPTLFSGCITEFESNTILKSRIKKEPDTGFNLQDQLDLWFRKIRSEPSITDADAEELKCHLLDMIEELKESGLDDEEAFWVASKRMGTVADWGDEYHEANQSVVQVRRTAIILSGVLAYFLCYHFIELSSKLLYIFLFQSGMDAFEAAHWIKKYIISIQILVALFFFGIYFMERKILSFIETIRINPKHTIILLITAIIFAAINTSAFPVIKNLVQSDPLILSRLFHIYRNFGYSFPLIMCCVFLLIYFKYYKISKF
jgi:hypothetical protein